ncbi:3-hydroxyacyl-ACP dehydratase [Flavitalea flava]
MHPEETMLSLIPQRPPFVMIDQLLYSDGKMARTAFRVPEENIFVEDGLFREPGLMENMAQTAAAGAGSISRIENKPVQVGYIGAVKNLQISGLPKINDELITEIRIEEQIFNATVISGKVWCNGVILAQCEMKIFI